MRHTLHLIVTLFFLYIQGCVDKNPNFDLLDYNTHYTTETRMCIPREEPSCQNRIRSQQPDIAMDSFLTGCLVHEDAAGSKWTTLVTFTGEEPILSAETNISLAGQVASALFFFQNEITEAACDNYSAHSSCTNSCIVVFTDTTDIIRGEHNVIEFMPDDGSECTVNWNEDALEREECTNNQDDNCNGIVNEGCAVACQPAGITGFGDSCGLNNTGVLRRQCLSDGNWGEYSCEDGAVCTNDETQDIVCGTNGTMTQVCEAGQWRNLPCIIEGAECNQTSEFPRNEQCGLNNRGIQTVRCNYEHELVFTACDDPDICRDEAFRYTGEVCGVNSRGREIELCVTGAWEIQPCEDPDECNNDSQRRFPNTCGRNNSGTLVQTCVQGNWTADFVCEGDTDSCENGATRPCYTGPSQTRDTGICTDGFETCSDGGWDSTCVNQTQPQAEICDGLDNDCDEVVDNTDQVGQACTNNASGICAAGGEIICMGNMEICTAPIIPPGEQELCDNSEQDENCDGSVDENCGCIVGNYDSIQTICGTGVCARQGETSCVGGEVEDSCEAGDPLSNEDDTCDGLDQDCDGRIDEDVTQEQTTCGFGVCATTGLTSCENGNIVDNCTPNIDLATPDSQCNNIDNDCDGNTDEVYMPVITVCGRGVCTNDGLTSCNNGNILDSCTPGEAILEDTTCNNSDEDCDGRADEGFVAMPTVCGAGICQSTGEVDCINGQPVDTCTPGQAGDIDICNGLDEDCDMRIDEDFVSEIITCGIGACLEEAQTRCENSVTIRNCIPGDPVEELCDGIDNNCDGTRDNGFNLGVLCNNGLGICSRPGIIICNPEDPTQALCNAIPGQPEEIDICDELDNNCDGVADETCCDPDQFSPIPTTCGVGVCQRDGELLCDENGEIQEACTPGHPPAATDESCDGLDNNCDGEIDNDYFDPTVIICGTGICARQGARTCNNGSVEDVCIPGDPDDNEICDGLDNDCDGTLDNGIDDIVCYTGNPDTENVGICQSGLRSCSDGQFGACVGEILPAEEICDGLDNDCDGEVDEGVECHHMPCSPNCPEIIWVRIEGGSFMMGSPEGVGASNEHPQHEVNVPSFEMMRNEVTVAQYRTCVSAGECSEPDCNNESESYEWLSCNYTHGREEHPVNYVSFEQMRVFGAWIGAELPSEAQWEFAARSGGQDFAYPWGDEAPDCNRTDWDNVNNSMGCVEGLGTSTVCTYEAGNSEQGLCDLAGNVREWVLDAYVNNYNNAPIDGSAYCILENCLDNSVRRIGRGGAWHNSTDDLRAARRDSSAPSRRNDAIGARLSRPLP
ncbi:MAG: formylglycine-generating enzyme family protein [Candidatus Magasanikbacteria bacterium]|jgi:formylglycine-generating enzyme required for sulfatase activity|nr:formylglycine-generating enzyme family protein [Candidatus Magasanikbacteria bacterium]